jgi:hypothetical protein
MLAEHCQEPAAVGVGRIIWGVSSVRERALAYSLLSMLSDANETVLDDVSCAPRAFSCYANRLVGHRRASGVSMDYASSPMLSGKHVGGARQARRQISN